MSGGVDSAVAALLVGEDAVAVTLELWRDVENDAAASCCSADAVRLARSVAHGMGLPHFTLDLRPEFRAGVVDPFLAGYAAGETPNPCVLLQRPRAAGRDARRSPTRSGCATLATGHYARVTDDGLLRAAADPAKDQAYMLAALSPASIARMRFPLAELTKPEVRAIAAEAGLPVASRAESQDLCFLAGTGKARFLARHAGLEDVPGEIVSARRRGRRRAPRRAPLHRRPAQGARRGGAPSRCTCCARAGTQVVVGSREELGVDRVRVRGARLHRPVVRGRRRAPALPREAPCPCRVHGEGATLELELGEPFYGAAPGQAACLLRGDVVVGGDDRALNGGHRGAVDRVTSTASRGDVRVTSWSTPTRSFLVDPVVGCRSGRSRLLGAPYRCECHAATEAASRISFSHHPVDLVA